MKLSHTALAVLLLGSFSFQAVAEFSAGLGYPYGGVIGVQYSVQQQRHMYTAALGLVGGAVGYHYLLDQQQRHSLGILAGSETISSEKGFVALQYSYYPQGAGHNGWRLGFNAGQRRADSSGFYGNHGQTNSHTLLGFHLGYRF